MEGIQRSKAWAVFLHVITMLPPTQLKGSESIFHGWCWPQNTEVATKLGTCLDLNSETQFKHRKIFQGNHGNLELYPNTTNQIYNILQHLPESQMVHFTHHNPWLYNPGFFRESFGSSGGLPEKVASWDRPQVWWTAGRRQWPGPADLHGSTNGSKMVCTTKKNMILVDHGTRNHFSWGGSEMFRIQLLFQHVENTCWTLSYKMISIHTLRQLNSLLWKPWPMKAHGWLIISITITHGKLLDCRGDQSIHINSNYP